MQRHGQAIVSEPLHALRRETGLRIAIFGSCVSRDAMDFNGNEDIVLGAYFARSSFGSAFSLGKVEDPYSAAIASTFQRRQVRQDFAKTFAETLPCLDFDILLVDFTDERFPLYVLNDGRVITVSTELRRTAFPAGMAGRLVKPFSEEHFRLWERGWNRFMHSMNETKSVSKIRINRALWSDTTESGETFDEKNTPQLINAANNHFKRLFRRCSENLTVSNFYDFDPGLFKGKDDHKWGKAPFHYWEPFYFATLAHLDRERSGAVLPPRHVGSPPI